MPLNPILKSILPHHVRFSWNCSHFLAIFYWSPKFGPPSEPKLEPMGKNWYEIRILHPKVSLEQLEWVWLRDLRKQLLHSVIDPIYFLCEPNLVLRISWKFYIIPINTTKVVVILWGVGRNFLYFRFSRILMTSSTKVLTSAKKNTSW